MRYTVKEICELLGAEAEDLEPGLAFDGYSIDSRTVKDGELFFAVTGEVHDGHRFVEDALAAGAAAAVVKRVFKRRDGSRSKLISGAEPLEAMQQLAAHSRSAEDLKLVGITGSCGKTTTKDIIAALLPERLGHGKNAGNLNNLYGLPLGLLRRRPGLDIYICEMGMSVPGEMSRLSRMAKPDLAVFTNIHGVHLMNFSSVREIAEAKAEMLEGLTAGGNIVANAEDPEVMRIANRSRRKIITFGFEDGADFRAVEIVDKGISGLDFKLLAGGKSIPIESPLPGTHNLQNLLAAIATGAALGLEPEELIAGINRIELSPYRSNIVEFEEGWTLYDDAYNSNPVALRKTIQALVRSNGYLRRIVVLGDMLELGQGEDEAHRECGAFLAGREIDRLIAVGPLAEKFVDGALEAGMAPEKATKVASAQEAIEPTIASIEENPKGTLVLVKGSRGVKMETVVAGLTRYFHPAAGPGKEQSSR